MNWTARNLNQQNITGKGTMVLIGRLERTPPRSIGGRRRHPPLGFRAALASAVREQAAMARQVASAAERRHGAANRGAGGLHRRA